MIRSVRHAAILVLLTLWSRSAFADDVRVRFDPSETVVRVGDVFSIDILADISRPIVGWGVDLTLTRPDIIAAMGDPMTLSPPWVAFVAPDGDGLVAAADPLAPINGSVMGDSVRLTTLHFIALTPGETDLELSVTPGDRTEGFPLDPTGFATVSFELGHVRVVPEPMTFLLVIFGMTLGVIGHALPRSTRKHA